MPKIDFPIYGTFWIGAIDFSFLNGSLLINLLSEPDNNVFYCALIFNSIKHIDVEYGNPNDLYSTPFFLGAIYEESTGRYIITSDTFEICLTCESEPELQYF